MANRILTAVLYLMLAAVVVSTVQSIWIGLTDTARHQRVFPGAQGGLYWLSQLMSGTAGLNALFIALRRRWAIWLNPVIGLASVGTLASVGSPWRNHLIVIVACAVSTVLPCYLGWVQASRR